jgi:hypothetical protein
LLIDVLLKDGAGAIVSLPNPFPPGLFRFRVDTIAGSAISQIFNGPEPQWISPVTARPGESCSVLGRRFWTEGDVLLVPQIADRGSEHQSQDALEVVGTVRSESEIRFSIPAGTAAGEYEVMWRPTGEEDTTNTTESTANHMRLTVETAPVFNGITVELTLPPPGGPDMTFLLEQAIRNASLNGTKPGGIVRLSAGYLLLNPPHEPPGTLRYNHSCGICGLGALFRTTIVGAGQDGTFLQAGNLISQAFWGAAVSLRDLTVTDYLDPLVHRNTTGENSDKGVPLAYQRALWSMDTCSWWGNVGMGQVLPNLPSNKHVCTDPWSSRPFAGSGLSFVRVTFDVTRADQGMTLRYTTGVQIDSCTFSGGQPLVIMGPSRDVRIEGSIFLGGGPAGGGVGALFIPTGYVSDVLFRNNTIDHLGPLEASTFPGRSLVTQGTGSVERLLFAGNLNRQAGPGGNENQNQGEQILFETGAWSGACNVHQVAADGLSVRVGWVLPDGDAVRTVLASRFRPASGASELWPIRGFNRASGDHDVALTTITINRGRGMGQVRRVVALGTDDHTLFLDRAFAIAPDNSSGITFSMGFSIDVIIRDNLFHGIAEHVDRAEHVATVLAFLWGNSHRVSYVNNTGKDLRQVIALEPSGNATQTDSVYRDIVVDHALTAVNVRVPLNFGWESFLGVSIRNVTVPNVVGVGIETMIVALNYGVTPHNGSCTSPPIGYAVFEDISLPTAKKMMANWQPEYQSSCPVLAHSKPTRFSGVVIKNVSGSGSANDSLAGVVADDSVAGVWTTSVTESGYKSSISKWSGNATAGHPQPGKPPSPRLQLFTSLVTGPRRVGGSTCLVWFANAGLADGEAKLVRLDPGLAIVGGANAWPLSKMSRPVSIEVELSSDELTAGKPRCGVLVMEGSDDQRNETFCITM